MLFSSGAAMAFAPTIKGLAAFVSYVTSDAEKLPTGDTLLPKLCRNELFWPKTAHRFSPVFSRQHLPVGSTAHRPVPAGNLSHKNNDKLHCPKSSCLLYN